MLAKDIINSQRYSFYTDYSDMWDIANCDGGTNKEAIFSINYTNSELENNAFDATATNSGNKGIVDFVQGSPAVRGSPFYMPAGPARGRCAQLEKAPAERWKTRLFLLDFPDLRLTH